MKNLSPIIFVILALLIMFLPHLIMLALPIIFFFIITSIAKNNTNSKHDFADLLWKFQRSKSWRMFVKNQWESFFNNFNFNQNNMINFNSKSLITGIWIFVFVMILIDWIVNVPAGHVAVLFDRGRWVLSESLWEWIHLKIPFWQNATKMDTRIQIYTMSIAPSEWDVYWDDAVESTTKDGQTVKVDMTVQFFLAKEDAPIVYQKVWLNYVEKVVRPAARSIIREMVTGYNSKEFFSIEKRQELQFKIEEKIKANLDSKKLTLDSALLRNIQFSSVYLGAIEEKQIAEQKIQKAEFEKQESLIRKEKLIIEAEAEAEAIKLKGQALRANKEMIQLEMINKLAPNIKWWVLPDGVMPLLDLKSMQ